jgi:flagellar hook protein FlgE
MESVADNISNVSTPGYKSTRAAFEDLIYQKLGGEGVENQPGNGAFTNVENIMTQSSMQSSENATDMAINGNGFFTVENPDDEGALYYTRSGGFTIDQNGLVVNDEGYVLKGFAVNDEGEINKNVLIDIVVPRAPRGAEPTDLVNLGINLNAADTRTFNASQDIDPANINTYNTITNFEVIDAAGVTHYLTACHQRQKNPDGGAGMTWKTSVFEYVGGSYTANPPSPDNTYYLRFNDQGQLSGVSPNGSAYAASGEIDLDFDFGRDQRVTLDYSPDARNSSTMLAGANETFYMDHNGYSAGMITGIDIDQYGMINALFSNEEQEQIGVVALTNFKSPTELNRIGGTLWQATAAAGLPQVEQPGDKDLAMGKVKAYALENSDVDMSEQFVNMINYQRAFQANSKSITTSDEMLQKAINLKA